MSEPGQLPTKQEVQQAIISLLDQVRNLNGLVEQQRTQVTGFDQIRATLAELELRVADFRNIPTNPQSHLSRINPTDLKAKDYDGNEKEFGDCLEDSQAYFEVVRPELGKLVDWLQYRPKSVDMAEVARFWPDRDAKARQLHGWLRNTLKGLARQWLKDKSPAAGIQTWRTMIAKYAPQYQRLFARLAGAHLQGDAGKEHQ